jgi:hypothetical protein
VVELQKTPAVPSLFAVKQTSKTSAKGRN